MEDVFLARQKIGNTTNVCFALDEMGQFWSLIDRDPTMDNVLLSLYTAKVTVRPNQTTPTINFSAPSYQLARCRTNGSKESQDTVHCFFSGIVP